MDYLLTTVRFNSPKSVNSVADLIRLTRWKQLWDVIKRGASGNR